MTATRPKMTLAQRAALTWLRHEGAALVRRPTFGGRGSPYSFEGGPSPAPKAGANLAETLVRNGWVDRSDTNEGPIRRWRLNDAGRDALFEAARRSRALRQAAHPPAAGRKAGFVERWSKVIKEGGGRRRGADFVAQVDAARAEEIGARDALVLTARRLARGEADVQAVRKASERLDAAEARIEALIGEAGK